MTARLRTLRRFSLDLCRGPSRRCGRRRSRLRRPARPHRQHGPPVAGRLAVSGGRTVLRRHQSGPGWAWPAAARTPGPAGRITGYWGEVFTTGGFEGHAARDDQSAFIASLGSNRPARMRGARHHPADQDALARAGSRGALVAEGGPGTGKIVVALDRLAPLLRPPPRPRRWRRALRRPEPAPRANRALRHGRRRGGGDAGGSTGSCGAEPPGQAVGQDHVVREFP